MSTKDKPPRIASTTCSCCGGNIFDAIVEHVWFELPTAWVFDFKGLGNVTDGRDRVDVEDVLALFVSLRVPVVAKRVTAPNRERLLSMQYEKQLSVVLELVARGFLG